MPCIHMDDILSVMMLMLAVTNISEATVLLQLLGAAIVGGAQTVSYTHLDVYKRQLRA